MSKEDWGESMQGTGVSKGLCLAKVIVFKESPIPLDGIWKGYEEEKRVFLSTAEDIYEKTRTLAEKTRQSVGKEEAAIFEAHCSILRDEELIRPIVEEIQKGKTAVKAIEEVIEGHIRIFQGMKNEYMRQRAGDLQDIKVQLQRTILGIAVPDLSELKEDAVIISRDIAPSVTGSMDLAHVAGMVMEGGGRTSHTSILARTLEIPAVVGVKGILDYAEDGDVAAVDGESGEVYLNPSEETCRAFRERIARERKRKEKRQRLAQLPCRTADGREIKLYGNIGTPGETERALICGAKGIGLLRSEFLYLSRDRIPREEEQYQAYASVLEAMGDAPVIVRTLDIGGDKEVPALGLEKEENPFLGLRAIRLCRAEEELFTTQIRALLRASEKGNLHIMFPMISSLEELRWAKERVGQCREQLIREGIAVKNKIPMGIMVEIPSTAVLAEAFAEECDFFSIGTNDLIQYTLAVDRGNDKVSQLYSFYHPSVLRLIRYTIEGAHEKGIPCGMCGEAAGDKKMIPLLIGLGLDEFSMSPGSLLEAREVIPRLDSRECRALAEQITGLKTAAETEQLLDGYLKKKEEEHE
ncbi:phosphoenolpyruvate--protein phosphotransferase [Lactonifactor longoviformis]|uniref:Phosphoenolpyruvate-protein phosphotransferase n=1 Tax=Lactonifactor longoviformis DSM 17459 TaxID=1122155 RepID=A0A1M5BWS0_9CLOT|nr:phosphoenolpyruvate--protein phosphotransferase [Lactonifactor longoviformis]POP33414.1 phosphoenolpyruvate--protein phosphotransferase [Lactonifactor longoviformis]SHF47053.1 phosphotransferase system, enzyme I, PtsI [Lactonifactor longoviformis DSM 17459]